MQPYTPGGVPRHLIGRDAQLAHIRRHLSPVVAYAEMAPSPLVFHGVRGMGKTSLLRHAQREAEAQGFVTAWVACSKGVPFVPDLEPAVRDGLRHTPHGTDAAWKSSRRTLGARIGIPGLRVETGVELSRAETPEPAGVAAIEMFLAETARTVRSGGGAGLVLFVDEWHAGPVVDSGALLNAVQNLSGRPEEHPLAVIGAGLPSVVGALTRAATFAERTAWSGIGTLDHAAAQELLIRPAAELEVSWSPAALEAAVRFGGGNPYFLQLVAAAAWEAADPDVSGLITSGPTSRGLIDVQHVETGREMAWAQAAEMFEARWQAATASEQQMIIAMAAAGSETVRRADIAQAVGLTSRALSKPRDRLIEKGVIQDVGRGLLSFTVPGFAAWVLERVGSGPT